MNRRPVWQGSKLSCVALCYSMGIVMDAVCNLVCAGPVDFSGGDSGSLGRETTMFHKVIFTAKEFLPFLDGRTEPLLPESVSKHGA